MLTYRLTPPWTVPTWSPPTPWPWPTPSYPGRRWWPTLALGTHGSGILTVILPFEFTMESSSFYTELCRKGAPNTLTVGSDPYTLTVGINSDTLTVGTILTH